MPMSPNSLTMMASRRPPAFSRIWRISVVLPAPRKPVTTVQGTRASGSGHELVLQKVEGRDARDEAALEAVGAAAPGQEAVGRGGEEFCAGDEIGAAVRRQVAEDIAPAAVAQDGGAESRRLQLPRHSIWRTRICRVAGGEPRRVAQQFAGAGMGVGAGLVAAGRADDHRDAGQIGRSSPACPLCQRKNAVDVQISAPCPGHPPGGRIFRRDGRSPGSRVVALAAFPGYSQWFSAFGSSLTVAGTAADLGSEPAPHSLLAPPFAGGDRLAANLGVRARCCQRGVTTRKCRPAPGRDRPPARPRCARGRASPASAAVPRRVRRRFAAARRARHRRRARAARRPGGQP